MMLPVWEGGELVIFTATDASEQDIDLLRAELQQHWDDPGHHSIVNFDVSIIYLPAEGSLISAVDASESQIDFLKAEMEKALKDPRHLVIIPFDISVQSLVLPVREPKP